MTSRVDAIARMESGRLHPVGDVVWVGRTFSPAAMLASGTTPSRHPDLRDDARMARAVLGPLPLVDALAQLPDLDPEERELTIGVQAPMALATPDTPVVVLELDEDDLEDEDEDWFPPGFVHLLEAHTALEAASVLDEWRSSPAGPRERAAAGIYYAVFDAYLPVGDETRPMGGFAQWGGSAGAAAEANLMTASELAARFPDRPVPSREDQRAVAPGDVVELMVWLATDDGPRPEMRPVRIESIDGDLLAANAVGAAIRLELRHDHIVGIPR